MSDEYLMNQPFSNELCVAYLMEFLAIVGRRTIVGDNDKSLYSCNVKQLTVDLVLRVDNYLSL